MQRDPGPLHNLGFGVTSRDIPTNEGEQEGDAPNSGYVTRALNGHPIMRFFAASAATIAGTVVASRVTKKGGLKLAKFIQQKADDSAHLGEATFSTSIVKSVTGLRRYLDELQGVTRTIKSKDNPDDLLDPYSKIVFEQNTKLGHPLTTGYNDIVARQTGYGFKTLQDKIDDASNFLTNEPAQVWTLRDQIQQNLVRAGRRLPYELPAMYATQKAVIEPLMGERDESKRKVKWYNPVDVVADFTKTSVTNIATMILPFEFAGAAASATRSSLHTLRYSQNDIRRLTPFQRKVHHGVREVSDLLTEVGHDFASMTDRFLRTAAQSSGALSAASDVYKRQGEFLQNLQSVRKGVQYARETAAKAGSSRKDIYKQTFVSIFKGVEDPVSKTSYGSIFDLHSVFRNMPKAFKAGRDEYKILGRAYNAMESSIAYNQVLIGMKGMTPDPIKANEMLSSAVQRLQSKHSSRLINFASGVRILGHGGPENSGFTSSAFYRGRQTDAFKDLLEQNLTPTVGRSSSSQFINNLKINIPSPGKTTEPSLVIEIGKAGKFSDGDDFFSTILKKYKGIKGGEDLARLTPAELERSVKDATTIFSSREFQRTMDARIRSEWNQLYQKDLLKVSDSILKPRKANFQDFVKIDSQAKQDFLRRRTAQKLGIDLMDEGGRPIADSVINKELALRGFDPTRYADMRGFLVRTREMNAGLFGTGGYNIFGFRPMTVGEASDRGLFSSLRKEEQSVINSLAARRGYEDPAASVLAMSKLDGVYKSRSGAILDFTAVKSTMAKAGHFLASELRIPILGFNPADLFGYRSIAEINNKSAVQYVSSRSVQPFVAAGEARPDFYLHARTKGTKGVVTAFKTSDRGLLRSERLAGSYRALPTSSADLLTRHARLASGNEGMTPNQIRGPQTSEFMSRIVGRERAERLGRFVSNFKSRMSIDSEQPNSLFGAMRRFKDRKSDPNNFSVMAGLLRGTDIPTADMTDDFLQAHKALRKDSFGFGQPIDVMRKLEKDNPAFFTMFGKSASDISTPQQAVSFAEDILNALPTMGKELRDRGIDPRQIHTSASRIRALLNEKNLSALSSMSHKSPTITTRLDQFRNEIFNYIAQTNQALYGRKGGNEIFVDIIKAVDDLHSKGVISTAQRAEAQAAGLGLMFNFSAFSTFSGSASKLVNAQEAVKTLQEIKTGAEELFDPYISGQIKQVSSSFRRQLGPILGPLNKHLGSAGYSIDDLSIDPLGSGQDTTLVPTFGTVFGRDPFGAIASALGLNTYRNPGAFSTGSVPVSQAVDRLNRYFGSIGMQLDNSDFAGPLDLFARGMVGKRVLPLYAAGATALTIDRTLGGLANGEDARGERVYSPLVLTQVAKGAVEVQSIAAGITPGGMSYQEKREQLLEGEVAIRQGRFWPLGNQPFRGGKVMYHRPSYYRKLQGAGTFTSDAFGSPMEKLLYYDDISPLRPFDPYRFERKHYEDRPYPVTGDYFTGPFGPLVPLANATVGRVMKPRVMMHEEEVAQGLSAYAPAGEFGAYDTSGYASARPMGGGGVMAGIGGGSIPNYQAMPGSQGTGQMPAMTFGPSASSSMTNVSIGSQNAELASRAAPTNMAAGMVRSDIANTNQSYVTAAAFGPPKVSGVMNPKIVPSGQSLSPGSTQFQMSELGYRTQEMLGIYGFAFGAMREGLGFGQSDLQPQRSVLQSASKGYGSTRAFWDLNLGGLGDVPLPSQDGIGNIEFSEIVRRFIPKERSGIDYINPISNRMGREYPFLPGAEYFTDFTRGDPYTKVQEGEIRLPGVGYERFNRMYSDDTGRYGLVNQLDILGDVAPYSQQYRQTNSLINKTALSPDERIKVQEIRDQVESATTRNEFTDYKYKGTTPEELGVRPSLHTLGRMGEYVAHSDNFAVRKTFGKETAIENWERNNVYGTTFPEWQRPFESYIQPMVNKATQGNPVAEAASLGVVGAMFGRGHRAKLLMSTLGVATGAGASVFGNASELATGDRFIPKERKKELALEEYSDILTYVKNVKLAKEAQAAGDGKAASQFTSAAGRTMYGMDLSSLQMPNRNMDMISLAIPKRKREHFKTMIDAPVEDRERILSTSGRLERRMYQAAWGMKVEKRPELAEYFSRHELPDENWEGWDAGTSTDHVKIKMGQSMGLEMSQMGYYPQQIKEANLANPSYPDFFGTQNSGDVTQQLRRLMTGMGMNGSVYPVMTPYGSQQINVSAGVG